MTLDDRITELVAIGASVAANCLPCLEHHVSKAAASGVEEQEIARAVEIARMVRRGAAAKLDRLAQGLQRGAPSEAGASTGGCGCA